MTKEGKVAYRRSYALPLDPFRFTRSANIAPGDALERQSSGKPIAAATHTLPLARLALLNSDHLQMRRENRRVDAHT